ncbi:MAG: ribonuclease Y [Defluviitaleaceae bacterium]|nr:ribonuclease Y [Defluviitaleaceae bacterium]
MSLSDPLVVGVICAVVGLFIGAIVGMAYRKKIAEGKIGSAELEAARIVERATIDSEAKKKEILLEAKEESIKTKNENEKENKERRNEIQRNEKRLTQKEENLDKKIETLEKKEEQLLKKSESIDKLKEELAAKINEQMGILEELAGFSREQAKEHLLESVRDDIKIELARLIKDMEVKAKLEADKKAQEILSGAIQRCAVDHVTETTVSVVSLPNDEMKGRIIGREGRNIRTLESLTGIDLIIDDTPEAVILSGFDAMRREIARLALEKLIVDGRIHPARIEEMVEKARKEVEVLIREEGEAATFETGIHGVHHELIRLLGKMKFRTSYGQNVLRHSIEVAHLSGLIASELGVDPTLAKRAGLLHDIGKSVDHDIEGTHVSIGAALCKKYRESDIIINAVESHHGDVEANNIISVIVQVADSISAARPGARRETLESYIKRLEKLEDIADKYKGVEKSFAIQAGRELRVVIIPEEVDDASLVLLAREISKKIEDELEYPGQIKVNLIRETRAIEYAK